MHFIKENPSLAAGIGLPVLLLILFSLAAFIPQWLVVPPKYDLLFSKIIYNDCNFKNAMIDFHTIDNHIEAKYKYPEVDNNSCGKTRKLYRFFVKNLSSQEIAFDAPAKQKSKDLEWTIFKIKEVESLKISSNSIAPDGYKFYRDGYDDRGIFPIFFGNHSYYGSYIIKGGRKIELNHSSEDYSYDNIEFLGWIIPDGEQNEQ